MARAYKIIYKSMTESRCSCFGFMPLLTTSAQVGSPWRQSRQKRETKLEVVDVAKQLMVEHNVSSQKGSI